MSEIVTACLSQFHDSEDEFELLIGYADGREIGHLVTRKNAVQIANGFATELGIDAEASARIAKLEAENQDLRSGSFLVGVVEERERFRRALEEAKDTLELVEEKAFPDPLHHDQVKQLGKMIGFGALMSTAEAGWREVLEEVGSPFGGEFVCGPCRSTVDNCLLVIRAAMSEETR